MAKEQAQSLMTIIKDTAPNMIVDLDFVRERYIKNYNATNVEKVGELMYERNKIQYLQILSNNPALSKCDPFSLFACFVTAAANGYSLDPDDNEVYLIPRDGKARLDRQAGAYVRKLKRTGQIKYAEGAKLVYKGDVFEVMGGRVHTHIERFESDEIIAGYVKFILDDAGRELHFIYRKSDWESWRKKSPNPKTVEKNGQYGKYLSESLWDNGVLNGTQPEPNFLKTKIIKHAAKEKCWSSASMPAAENYTEVEIDTEDDGNGGTNLVAREMDDKKLSGQYAPTMVVTPAAPVNDESFANEPEHKAGVRFDDDNF